MLNMRRLGYFIAVAESQSLRQAAERLHISQPPLSRAVAQLEQEVGAKLLERTRHGVRVTPEGEHFLRSALDIMRRSDDLIGETRRRMEGGSGTLRIALTAGFKHGPLPLAIARFISKHPNVRCMTDTGHSPALLKRLQQEEFDLLLMPMPLPANVAGLASRELGSVPLRLFVSPQHRLARRRTVRLTELAGERLIFSRLLPGSGYYQPIMDAFHQADVVPDLMTDITPGEVVAGLVALNVGVTLDAPEALSADGLGLRSIAIVDPPIVVERGVVFRRGDTTGLVRNFVDELVLAFQAISPRKAAVPRTR